MDRMLPSGLFGNGVVAAPMAGGPSNPPLAEAAGRAGGVGFLAAGYKSAERLAGELEALFATGLGFGVNLFVPRDEGLDRGAVLAYRERLRPVARRLGVELPEPRWEDDDAYPAKLDILLERVPPIVSFTFALPPARDVARLRAAGAFTIQTVTTADEARAAEDLGVDAVVVQHPSAGGHSGAFLADPLLAAFSGTLPELVAEVRGAVGLPLLAAGGIGTPTDADAARHAGASAVQLGTAFLRTPEAGTNAVHRRALTDAAFDRTAQTRAFSGKVARGLENGFMRDFADGPAGYPVIHYLTAPLRAAAVAAGDPHGTNLWAGTGWKSARDEPARDVVAHFAG
ncbi:nitronate monooxygenase [Sinomonas sp. JGH33]|uniref:Propionate 3-nitronate monooxygenase n=1 Tax=Sinomonas terricola TaxID=3110330 RepID=A0ABU5T105_9MICC|nr:nitronate monooxygenase [Sinomonas sp. JGH33]MEA5453324.1 nitronate monooxygenase [Sinomonas sp. JGH33]